MELSKKDVSPLEFELMEVLWRNGEATSREILDSLRAQRALAHTTIATLLMRMRRKGCVDYSDDGGVRIYRPLVSRDEIVRSKLDDLVQGVMGGNVTPLLEYVADYHELTQEQIEQLEDILLSQQFSVDE
jgi:BlaI family transcriptional regulator, penicillinase repressor